MMLISRLRIDSAMSAIIPEKCPTIMILMNGKSFRNRRQLNSNTCIWLKEWVNT